MATHMQVEVVFAERDRQELLTLDLPEGSTVADAIKASKLEKQFPAADLFASPVGIWGHIVEMDRVLVAGDRVEIYRPLRVDPREARRQLALHGKTMASSSKD